MWEIQEPWQVFEDRERLEYTRELRYQEREEPDYDYTERRIWEQEDEEWKNYHRR